MGIQFNGNVTINGNVEVFDNGSMKITGNQVNVDISEFTEFIEKNFPYSANKENYVKASEVLKDSTDKDAIEKAVHTIKTMGLELGKSITVAGLSPIAVEVIKKILGMP